MYKVLIVDDEITVREGLVRVIDWEDCNCVVCGEAGSGEQGIDMITEIKPDIIITDIRMRIVSGLEMIEKVKSVSGNAKIIILTGHREFDYAQEGVRLGVFDFILKPTDLDVLTESVKRAVKKLEGENSREEELGTYKKIFYKNIPILKERLLYDIIFNINTENDNISKELEFYDININNFFVMVFEHDGKSYNELEDHRVLQTGISKIVKDVFSDHEKIFDILNADKSIFVVEIENEVLNSDLLCRKCENVLEKISNISERTFSVGISSAGYGIMDISSKFTEAEFALSHKFYIGDDSILFFKDIEPMQTFEGILNILADKEKILIQAVSVGNIELTLKTLEVIDELNSKLNGNRLSILKKFFREVVLSVNEIRTYILKKEGGVKPNVSVSFYKLVEEADDTAALMSVLREVSLNVAELVNEYNNKTISIKVKKAIEFINENYMKQITLNDVAESIFVSSNYTSKIFKRELGMNFSDYLIDVRIKKAKMLLKNIEYKNYEIAEMVGIPDAYYFSKIFKRITGCTPSEFRNIE